MKKTQTATLAGGCFWCTPAIFERLIGVEQAVVGYTGGTLDNPSYEQVSMGNTGHAEAVQIEFDPTQISFEKLLEVFWAIHDPTTLNSQGADVGPQYRSAIFYHDEDQKRIAEQSKAKLNESGTYPNPAVTEIVPFTTFYTAEKYHQNYFEKNPDAAYCRVVIDPKVHKLMRHFSADLKK